MVGMYKQIVFSAMLSVGMGVLAMDGPPVHLIPFIPAGAPGSPAGRRAVMTYTPPAPCRINAACAFEEVSLLIAQFTQESDEEKLRIAREIRVYCDLLRKNEALLTAEQRTSYQYWDAVAQSCVHEMTPAIGSACRRLNFGDVNNDFFDEENSDLPPLFIDC